MDFPSNHQQEDLQNLSFINRYIKLSDYAYSYANISEKLWIFIRIIKYMCSVWFDSDVGKMGCLAQCKLSSITINEGWDSY